MTQSYQFVNDPNDLSSTATSSSLPTMVSLPSTPFVSDLPQYNAFLPELQQILNNRYQEIQSSNEPLRIICNNFVATALPYEPHTDNTRQYK